MFSYINNTFQKNDNNLLECKNKRTNLTNTPFLMIFFIVSVSYCTRTSFVKSDFNKRSLNFIK